MTFLDSFGWFCLFALFGLLCGLIAYLIACLTNDR